MLHSIAPELVAIPEDNMRVLLYSGPEDFSIREAGRSLKDGELRLAATRMGICGADLHLDEGGFGGR